MVLSPEKIEEIKKIVMSVPPEQREAKIQEIISSLDPDEVKQLQTGGQCPFCLMVEGRIEVKKIYEDEKAIAILDINPASKGHTLVFPKQHHTLLTELSDKDSSHLFKVVVEVAKALTSAFESQGVNIFVASGSAAGQTAPHLLVNIIPRFDNDGIKFGWATKKCSNEELEQINAKVAEKTKTIKFAKEVAVIKKELPKEELKEELHTRIP